MDPFTRNLQQPSSDTSLGNSQANPFMQNLQNISSDTSVTQNPFQKSINPNDVSSAISKNGNQDFNGECQKFVEQMTYGHSGIFQSAVDAWNNYVQDNQARGDLQNMKPGDILYFSPNQSNEGFGHTGIYMGNNQFVSATDNGIMPYDLNNWQKQTGQQILGFVPVGGK